MGDERYEWSTRTRSNSALPRHSASHTHDSGPRFQRRKRPLRVVTANAPAHAQEVTAPNSAGVFYDIHGSDF